MDKCVMDGEHKTKKINVGDMGEILRGDLKTKSKLNSYLYYSTRIIFKLKITGKSIIQSSVG